MRKSIELTGKLFETLNVFGWRQYQHKVKKLKKLYLIAQRSKKSKAKNANNLIKQFHKNYIEQAETQLYKVKLSLFHLEKECTLSPIDFVKIEEIQKYITHAQRQIDQIDRRVLQGKTIPSNEKVYSIIFLFFTFTHRSNIARLVRREEKKIGEKIR